MKVSELLLDFYCGTTYIIFYSLFHIATEDEEQKSSSLADKVTLYKGDITILELDAIVNAGEYSDSN